MIRSMLAYPISLLKRYSGANAPADEIVEPLYGSYAFPTVPSGTDRLFDEVERRIADEKPLRLLDLPVL